MGLAAVMNVLFSLCKTWLREGERGEVGLLLVDEQVASQCSMECSALQVPYLRHGLTPLPSIPTPSCQMLR